MNSINETEENQMYKYLSDALFEVCEKKPSNPIGFLSKHLLYLIGDDPELISKSMTKGKVNTSSNHFKKFTNEESNSISMGNLLDSKQRRFSDFYKIGKKLEQSSSYFLCTDIKTDSSYTVKIVNKKLYTAFISDDVLEQYMKLSHAHLCNVIDIIEEHYFIYIIEEYCENGDIINLLASKDIKLGEQLIKTIISQLLSVILYLNAQKIYHGDIRPENIMIHTKSPEIIIKLKSVCLISLLQNTKTQAKRLGSAYYMAPELLIKNEDNSKCDLWSLGVLTYNLLTGTNFFEGDEHEALVKSQFMPIKRNIVQKGLLNKNSMDFIEKLIERNIEKRMTGEQAHDHEWMTSLDTELHDKVESEFLKSLVTYANGNLFKRSVVNFMAHKNFYDTQNFQLLKLFQELDADHSGKIEVDELFNHYGKYFPGTEKEVLDRIDKLVRKVYFEHEEEKIPSIDYKEFLVLTSRISGDFEKEKLVEVFNAIDTEKNGYLDLEDIKKFIKHPKLKDDKLLGLIQKYDKNNDKKISFTEFYDMICE